MKLVTERKPTYVDRAAGNVGTFKNIINIHSMPEVSDKM
jgi:hypothetical protein